MLLGHRYRFTATGATMQWTCIRGCGEGGRKKYADPAAAARYARGFNRKDSDDIGKRAPLIGMFPLRLWRAWRRRH
jgi:hypothetical protein